METKVNISVKLIKELEFGFLNKKNIDLENITLNFSVNTLVEKENDSFTLDTKVTFNDKNDNSELVHITVSNVFLVQNIVQFETDGVFNIPDGILLTFLSLSISHTRALLAKNTAGSVYESLYIPVVNPTEIANQIFKK